MDESSYLIDTNILLRITRVDDPDCSLVQHCLRTLITRRATFHYSLQNIAEFWNVCTRPVERNGFGLSPFEADQDVVAIEESMTFLPDTKEVYSHWRRLVVDHSIRGVQVHDARLVAVMLAYGIPHIFTLNDADFLRFPEITATNRARSSAD